MSPTRAPGALLLAAALAFCFRPAAAQEPEPSPRPGAGRDCTLTWEPIDPDAELVGTREDAEAFISRFRGRMLFTCGTATMEADSTVKYDRLGKLDFIGNVVYRDTIRTLSSRLLTYLELEDLVIARDSVELVRIVDGSRLRGPEVRFLRAVSGIDAQTTATGRPHMTFYPESEEPQEPFEIDADRASFAGEEEARFHGDVVIARSDLDAEADSAYLRRDDGSGVMWGRPWVETEEIRLDGDTIRFRSEEEELREVRAVGDARASGRQFDVHAERIDAALAAGEVEEVWAHGEGLSEALSGGHELYGDSLRFVLVASEIDTVVSVGSAAAIQRDSMPAAEGIAAPDPGGAVPDSAGAVPDSAAAAPDSAARETPPPDSLARALEPPVAAPDTTPALELMEEVLASIVPGDSAAAAGEGEAGRTPSDSTGAEEVLPPLPMPQLATDGSTNWVTGDTVIAVFERRVPSEPDSAAGADSTATPPEPGEAPPGEVAPDSLEGARPTPPADPAAADTTADPRLERLIAIANARSFYRQVRDTAATARPSRNYMIGSRIEILFEEGEPRKVFGRNAIGIYLEPEEAVPSGAAADSVSSPPDTVSSPPDTVSTPPDTVSSPPDTVSSPPDTVRISTGPDRSPPAPTNRPSAWATAPTRRATSADPVRRSP